MKIAQQSLTLSAMMLLTVFWFEGCLPAPVKVPQTTGEAAAQAESERRQRYRTRPPIATTRNLYEGGLWRGAASWGNLMRDHRARYRGDLLTVREMARIIKVPEVRADPQAVQAANQQPAEGTGTREDPVIAYLRDMEKRRQLADQEQNEILRSVESMEVEVYRVLPNGNLLVRGNHPPIFRDRNRIKYVISLRGMVRPSDVDDSNSIPALKLSKAEYKIRRLVRRERVVSQEIASAARAAGAQREAEFVERVSNATQ